MIQWHLTPFSTPYLADARLSLGCDAAARKQELPAPVSAMYAPAHALTEHRAIENTVHYVIDDDILDFDDN